MEKRRNYTRLALVLLVLILATAWLKPLWQKAWLYMSSAVIPNTTRTLSFANQGKLMLEVGGERWASWYAQEQATAFHALVIPPEGAIRQDDGSSGGTDITHKVTLMWLHTKEQGGNPPQAEAKSFTIVYHSLTQRVSVGSETYRLAKGNVFLIRLDDEWQPRVTQGEAVLDKPADHDEVIEVFKRVFPDDEEVKKLP